MWPMSPGHFYLPSEASSGLSLDFSELIGTTFGGGLGLVEDMDSGGENQESVFLGRCYGLNRVPQKDTLKS